MFLRFGVVASDRGRRNEDGGVAAQDLLVIHTIWRQFIDTKHERLAFRTLMRMAY